MSPIPLVGVPFHPRRACGRATTRKIASQAALPTSEVSQLQGLTRCMALKLLPLVC